MPAPPGRVPVGARRPVRRTWWVGERGVVRSHVSHRHEGGDLFASWEPVAELTLQQVPDHAFGLGVQHVEGIPADVVVRRSLEGEQTDLWAVACVMTS